MADRKDDEEASLITGCHMAWLQCAPLWSGIRCDGCQFHFFRRASSTGEGLANAGCDQDGQLATGVLSHSKKRFQCFSRATHRWYSSRERLEGGNTRKRKQVEEDEIDEMQEYSSFVEMALSWPLRWVSPRWRMRVVWLWAMVGIALLAVLFSILWDQAKETRKHALQRKCNRWGNFVENQFNTTSLNVRAVSDLVRSYYYDAKKPENLLDMGMFERYMQSSQSCRPMAAYVGYSVRVSNPKRKEFEAFVKQCIYSAYFGPLNCTKAQPEYVPLLLSFTNSGISLGLPYKLVQGLDSLSDPSFAEAMRRVNQGKVGAISSPFYLGSPLGPLVSQVFPVFKNHSSYDYPVTSSAAAFKDCIGYVYAVFNFTFLASAPIYRLLDKNIGTGIFDETNSNRPVLLYSSISERALGEKEHTKKHAEVRLHLGDDERVIFIHCKYIRESFVPVSAIFWILILFVALALSVFLLRTTASFMAKLERDFKEMEVVRDRMRRAKQLAEAASQAKGAWLTTMSHEIRTPMNGVIGMLNLLLQTNLEATQLDFVETARTSGRALCALMNDILDLSKIETDSLDLEHVQFDIRHEIDDVLALFVERDDDRREVEVAAFVADDVPALVIADALRIRQVLTNLLSNAIKFTTRGHVLLLVRVARPDEVFPQSSASRAVSSSQECPPDDALTPVHESVSLSGREVLQSVCSWSQVKALMDPQHCGKLRGSCQYGNGQPIRLIFAVEDTGLGIPMAARGGLFRPFTQVDLSTTRLHGGTGIGLAISQKLIKMMGGSISFVSEPDVGSTFFFDVMVDAVECMAPCLGPKEACAGHLQKGMDGLKGLRVLVVDDNALRLPVTLSLLRRIGMVPSFCTRFDDIPASVLQRNESYSSAPSNLLLSHSLPVCPSSESEVSPSPSFASIGQGSPLDSKGYPGSMAAFSAAKPDRLSPEPFCGSGAPFRSSLQSAIPFLKPISGAGHDHSVSTERGLLSFGSMTCSEDSEIPLAKDSALCAMDALSASQRASNRKLTRKSSSVHSSCHGDAAQRVSAIFVEEEMFERCNMTIERLQELIEQWPFHAVSPSPSNSFDSSETPALVLLVAGANHTSAQRPGFDAILRKPLRVSGVSACLRPLFASDLSSLPDAENGPLETFSGSHGEVEGPKQDPPAHLLSPFQSGLRQADSLKSSSNIRLHSDIVAEGVEWGESTGAHVSSRNYLANLEGKRLLVVDDNLINRKVIKKMLESYKATVTTVEGGRRALEELKDGHTYDIVFMDLQMPEMDGIEATRRIREEEESRAEAAGVCIRVPILALTADVVAGTREKCLRSGMDFYLTKPIEEDQLVKAMTSLFPLTSA